MHSWFKAVQVRDARKKKEGDPAWGLGWSQELWTLILRVPPSLQEEEVVDEAYPHFLMFRALLPRHPHPQTI